MIVVSDTTTINYLVLIGRIDLIPRLFVRVSVPPLVIDELLHARSPGPVRAWAGAPPGWVDIRAHTHVDPALSSRLQEGEAHALALAEEVRAGIVLLDDREARDVARERKLAVVGTLGVLREAAYRGFIDIDQEISKLRRTSYRAAESLYQSVADRVHEHLEKGRPKDRGDSGHDP